MPFVFRDGPYRFFFYSNEGNEPPHVHIRRDACEAKFWLDPIACAVSDFSEKEQNKIAKLVEENRHAILEKWNEHFHPGI